MKHSKKDRYGRSILSVVKHSGNKKVDSTSTAEDLQGYDVVLTTYTEVLRSYPKCEMPLECQTKEEKAAYWKNFYEENRGVLHRIKFLRIVLDEAQAIKNYKSRTSIACRGLMAEKRWAMSGTPIQNSISELYPYFKFLRVPHTGTYRIFQQNFAALESNDQDKVDRLIVTLSVFTTSERRRTY